MGDLLTNTMCDLLELIGRFKYLTFSQAKPLVKKSTSYVREQLARMKSFGLIASYNLEKPIKSESLYYLTEKGKEVLLSNAKVFADDIRLVVGVPMIVRDIGHRKSTVQIHISLYYHLMAIGITITEYLCYFDKSGNNRREGNLEARTKIPVNDTFFIPDSIMLTHSNDKTSIYLVECFCDIVASRPIEQLLTKHIPAIAQGSPAKKFGLACNPFVLSAFESESTKNKVVEKLRQRSGFKAFEHLFYFCSIAELLQDPANTWKDIHGTPITFT